MTKVMYILLFAVVLAWSLALYTEDRMVSPPRATAPVYSVNVAFELGGSPSLDGVF